MMSRIEKEKKRGGPMRLFKLLSVVFVALLTLSSCMDRSMRSRSMDDGSGTIADKDLTTADDPNCIDKTVCENNTSADCDAAQQMYMKAKQECIAKCKNADGKVDSDCENNNCVPLTQKLGEEVQAACPQICTVVKDCSAPNQEVCDLAQKVYAKAKGSYVAKCTTASGGFDAACFEGFKIALDNLSATVTRACSVAGLDDCAASQLEYSNAKNAYIYIFTYVS